MSATPSAGTLSLPSACGEEELACLAAMSMPALDALRIERWQRRWGAELQPRSEEVSEPLVSGPHGSSDPAPKRAGRLVSPMPDAVVKEESLGTLLASCGERLWTQESGRAGEQGVLLDIGHWLPGCTAEITRAAGLLQLRLQGVPAGRRQAIEQALAELADGMAQRLGCPVLTAVEACSR